LIEYYQLFGWGNHHASSSDISRAASCTTWSRTFRCRRTAFLKQVANACNDFSRTELTKYVFRSYFRCRHKRCSAKKKVEWLPSDAGGDLRIVYEGVHQHGSPPSATGGQPRQPVRAGRAVLRWVGIALMTTTVPAAPSECDDRAAGGHDICSRRLTTCAGAK
jgi:hypothetical protein